jgi:hypothetical protein
MKLDGVKVGFQTGLDMMNQGTTSAAQTNISMDFTTVSAQKEVSYTFMDLVENMASESNVLFVPANKRHETNGRELFKLDKCLIYFDDGVIFMKNIVAGVDGVFKWEALNVDDAIDRALGLI